MKIDSGTFAIGIAVTIFILVILALGYGVAKLGEGLDEFGNKFDEVKEEMSSKVGEEFVLNKDTLVIVDYSVLKSNFTLSNGVQVDYRVVVRQDSLKEITNQKEND